MIIGVGSSCTFERICRILIHPTRRTLIRRLRTIETPTKLRTVAAELAETERVETPERAEMMLHHVHLPKLADAEVLEYDPDTGVIRTNETTDAVYDVLETLAD